MTNHSAASADSDGRDLGELSRAILEGERRTVAEPLPAPPRRIVPGAVASLRVPAIVAELLLAAWVVVAGLGVVFALMQRSLMQRVIDDPTQVRFSEVLADEHRTDLLNGVFLGMVIVGGIAFVAWFRRAYRNLDALDSPRRYGVGWATGAWFVPVINLVRPKRIADDIWAANAPAGFAGQRSDVPAPKSALIFGWWSAWVAAAVLGYVSRFSHDPKTAREAMNLNGAYLARDVALMVAAVLGVLVVRRITEGQRAVVAASRAG